MDNIALYPFAEITHTIVSTDTTQTMCSAAGRVKLLLATYAAFICVVHHSCGAQVENNTIKDCASSCGNIHNIAYPFRLDTDPIHCGTETYQLSCENNVVMLHLEGYGGHVQGYQVQAINYNNFTIRLSDPNVILDNCALPAVSNRSVHNYSIPRWLGIYDYEYTCRPIIFVSCPYPVTGSVYEVYSTPCNLRRHWYLYVDYVFYDDHVSDLENSCRIEAIAVTSLLLYPAKSITYVDVKNSFAYGFEFSWSWACCYTSEVSRKYNCSDYPCYHDTRSKDERIRDRMTGDFNSMFSFLPNIKVTAFLSRMLASLTSTLDGLCYDVHSSDRLTIFGLIIHFLFAILVVLVLHRLLLCFLGLICVTIFLIYKWRRQHLSAYDNIEEFLQSHQDYLMPVRYSYSEIKKFTKGFKEKLGEGGYGSVYRGKLRSGRLVAIKMLDKSKGDGQDFINEVATIGRIHHVNVVQLIGFCVKGSKRALVYEFMDNGSLDKHIFFKEGCLPMNNKTIFNISLGVARGIEYLHQGCDMQILHFDIKPHNILLDEKFVPKISDFGLAKLHSTDHSIVSLTAVRGTMGYIAPEFFYKNIEGISYKADIYSFGMLLMEMIGRRKNISAFTKHSSRIYFPSWIYDQLNERKEIKLGDETEETCNLVKKMIIVALWCIQLNPVNHPSMSKIIKMLEEKVEHLKIPPKPFVAPQESPTNDAGLNTNPKIWPTESSTDHSNSISLLID